MIKRPLSNNSPHAGAWRSASISRIGGGGGLLAAATVLGWRGTSTRFFHDRMHFCDGLSKYDGTSFLWARCLSVITGLPMTARHGMIAAGLCMINLPFYASEHFYGRMSFHDCSPFHDRGRLSMTRTSFSGREIFLCGVHHFRSQEPWEHDGQKSTPH
jgi:hypothetical protein